MKLYQSIGPNPRVVTMYIAEKGIAVDRVFLDIMKSENRQAEHLARNPGGGVPVLELGDGTCVTESLAICEYLEEINPAQPLVGSTAGERAVTRAAIRTIDQTIVVPMTNGFRCAEGLPMFQSRMLCIPETAEGNKAYARDGLTAIDARLAGGGWICGDRFTLADILLFAFVDFGGNVGQPIPDGLDNLKAWSIRVASRPSAAISANPHNGI